MKTQKKNIKMNRNTSHFKQLYNAGVLIKVEIIKQAARLRCDSHFTSAHMTASKAHRWPLSQFRSCPLSVKVQVNCALNKYFSIVTLELLHYVLEIQKVSMHSSEALLSIALARLTHGWQKLWASPAHTDGRHTPTETQHPESWLAKQRIRTEDGWKAKLACRSSAFKVTTAEPRPSHCSNW